MTNPECKSICVNLLQYVAICETICRQLTALPEIKLPPLMVHLFSFISSNFICRKSQCPVKGKLCALEAEPVERLELDKNNSTNSPRFDQFGHFPVLERVGYRVKCEMEGCNHNSFVSCSKCQVHLCLIQDRNCFIKFHVVESSSLQISKPCLGIQNATEKKPTNVTRFDQSGHFPVLERVGNSVRCKKEGCRYKTFVSCYKCKVHLCLIKDRNCFKKFHHRTWCFNELFCRIKQCRDYHYIPKK